MDIRLANEHRLVLDNLSTLAINDMIVLVDNASTRDFGYFAQAMREGIPAITEQYGQVAALASSEYYNLLRADAAVTTGTTYAAYEASSELYDTALLTKNINGNVATGLGKVYYGYSTYDDIKSFFAGGVQKNVNDYSRTNIIGNTGFDSAFQTYRRIPSFTACAWCKYKAVIIDGGNTEPTISDDGFHNNCKCVIGVGFENELEANFRQAFYGTYEQDFRKAEQLIKDDKIDYTRQVRKGSPEYETAVRKDLLSQSREWRKNHPNQTKEFQDRQRADTKTISASIAKKLKTGEPLTNKELTILDTWGYDLNNATGLRAPITSTSASNVLAVMRKEFGYK